MVRVEVQRTAVGNQAKICDKCSGNGLDACLGFRSAGDGNSAYHVTELPARRDVEFNEDVGKMGTDGTRGNPKRLSDLRVGFVGRDEFCSLRFPSRELLLRWQRLPGRPDAVFTQLISYTAKIALRAQGHQHVVSVAQLPYRRVTVARVPQRARQLPPNARCILDEGDRFQILRCSSKQWNGANGVVVVEQHKQRIARVRPGEPEAMIDSLCIQSHAPAQLLRTIEVVQPERRLAHCWKQSVYRPDDVTRPVGERESGITGTDSGCVITGCKVIGGEPHLHWNRGVWIACRRIGIARARYLRRFL